MLINTKKMISISEVNQNFSKIAKIVDEDKFVVVMKNNKPKYGIIDFDEFNKAAVTEEEELDKIADQIFMKNMNTFKELAK